MSKLFRPHASLSMLTALMLCACGGGGSDTTIEARPNSLPPANGIQILPGSTGVEPSVHEYDFADKVQYEVLGPGRLAYVSLLGTEGLKVHVGHLLGAPDKYFVTVARSRAPTAAYDCISAAWDDADKAAIQTASGFVPASCDNATVSYDAATRAFALKTATLLNNAKPGDQIVINLPQTTLPRIPDQLIHVMSDNGVAAGAYEFTVNDTPAFEFIGEHQLGYTKLSANQGLAIHVGHLKGDAGKFFVSVTKSGLAGDYTCLGGAWTDAEKAAMQAEFGHVPGTCDAAITYVADGATSQRFAINRATLLNQDGQEIVLDVSATLPTITFP